MSMRLLYYPEIWRKPLKNSKIDDLNFNARQNDGKKCHATLVTICRWTSIHFHVLVISLTLTCFSLWNIYWLSNNLSTFSTKEIWISRPDPTSGFLFFFRWLLLWNKSRSCRSVKASITEETLSAQITRCKNARRTR